MMVAEALDMLLRRQPPGPLLRFTHFSAVFNGSPKRWEFMYLPGISPWRELHSFARNFVRRMAFWPEANQAQRRTGTVAARLLGRFLAGLEQKARHGDARPPP